MWWSTSLNCVASCEARPGAAKTVRPSSSDFRPLLLGLLENYSMFRHAYYMYKELHIATHNAISRRIMLNKSLGRRPSSVVLSGGYHKKRLTDT